MREENGTKEQLANELTAMRQRVAELEAILEGSETLEQVARAVSSGLNLETTLETIYGQVQRIMPVDAFYVALYDEDTQLITYPLVYDQHQRYE
jgi:transcriptional regulator with GAF, ATPase, and Fis domain